MGKNVLSNQKIFIVPATQHGCRTKPLLTYIIGVTLAGWFVADGK